MKILRTPDDAVDGLCGYPSERRWVEIPSGEGQRLRVHLVDANPDASSVIVLLHGNPSWSYLWRHQIGPLVDAGYRVIAPDLVGMGMSDKPAALDDYTVDRHVEWMRALLVDALALCDIDMVLHDWGGIIGLRSIGALAGVGVHGHAVDAAGAAELGTSGQPRDLAGLAGVRAHGLRAGRRTADALQDLWL